MTLTILCVTMFEPCTDNLRGHMERLAFDVGAGMVFYQDADAACIEECLDDAIAECPDGHILRLDDDEGVWGMREWLFTGEYRNRDHWAFRRANLYPDKDHYLTNSELWPDFQTRLSTKAKSGGRTRPHVGSPYGTGWLAAPVIAHHKFLIRSEQERQALVEQYEGAGASAQFRVMAFPELAQGGPQVEPVPKLMVAA